jgi:hypothetical protein
MLVREHLRLQLSLNSIVRPARLHCSAHSGKDYHIMGHAYRVNRAEACRLLQFPHAPHVDARQSCRRSRLRTQLHRCVWFHAHQLWHESWLVEASAAAAPGPYCRRQSCNDEYRPPLAQPGNVMSPRIGTAISQTLMQDRLSLRAVLLLLNHRPKLICDLVMRLHHTSKSVQTGRWHAVRGRGRDRP